MIEEVCAEVKNYFCDENDRHIGDWTISGGVLTPSILFNGDYVRIVGSHKNDGVYKVSEMELEDETFHGGIWDMSPPKSFLELVEDIKLWDNTNGAVDSVAMSPYQSESLGVYNYSKNGGSDSGFPSWRSAYASRLKRFRRVREL